MGSMLNGTQNSAKGHVGIPSNGSLNGSYHCTTSELCKRSLFDILTSKKFTELCNLLFENFQGLKVDSIFDFSLINSRMKEGAYESSPMLFHSDIQQVWTKLQKVGTEMVALAKSLLDKSSISCAQVGGSIHSSSEDGRHDSQEFLRHKFDVHAKPERTETCGTYRFCTCRRCGEKADGKDCVVCDSCEEMYHISCIEPAVKEIPLKSWSCANCTPMGIELPHENCVVCDRLNAPRSPTSEVDGVLTNEEKTILEIEEHSNALEEEDGLLPLEGDKNLHFCHICGNEVENGRDFRICGHSGCPYKYYHATCLTRKQLSSYGPRWYCPSCLCRGCLTDRDDDKIVICDGCDHAYHIYCMQPPRSSIPKGRTWFCIKCDAGIQRVRKAKRAYEIMQNKLKKRAEAGKGAFENVKNVQKRIGEEVLERSGGVDLLLTAADTLNFVEKLAALTN